LEKKLSEAMQQAARRHGVSVDALVNMWLQEKILEETSAPE
jgi:predicted HicB family RNase H-like nuclease